MPLNLDYLYDFQKKGYERCFNESLQEVDSLYVKRVDNCYVLPVRRDPSKLLGLGGVLDKDLQEVRESFIVAGKNSRSIYYGGKYIFEQDNVEYLKGTYIYLGCIGNHWGHFLVDYCTRLWYAKKHKDMKCIFMTNENTDLTLIKPIVRFIELLGIPLSNVIILSKPIKVENLLIPQQSYQTSEYVSSEYRDLFDTVRLNITPSEKYKKKKKVYFTRKNLNKAQGSEVGIELMDNFFSKNGFELVSPENESLDDQIAYICNCDVYACISGTLIHNLLFLDSNNFRGNIYVLNKTYLINYIAMDTIRIKRIFPIFIDSYIAKYPVSLGHGPFAVVPNVCFQNFMRDFKYIKYDSRYESYEYISKIVTEYEFMYHNINLLPNRRGNFSKITPDSYFYFSVQNILFWVEHYSEYELLDKNVYRLFRSYKEICDALNKAMSISVPTLNRLVTDNYILYSVHVSNFGWTNIVIDSHYAGFISNSNSVEAIYIKSPYNIKCKCYYENEGWTDFYTNDQVCGSTGRAKTIHGLCIDSNDITLKYRVYDRKNGWTDYCCNGIEINVPNGFSALEIRIIKSSK